MSIFDIAAILVVAAAALAYLNERFARLPFTIGPMLIALVLSLTLIVSGNLGLDGIKNSARHVLEQLDFSETLIHGMLRQGSRSRAYSGCLYSVS
jgi:CPA1 family monovalent cation:H+ antiporter